MRLKHLFLQGYKTFANKTEFLFPTGITAIVGPNGSGKSNIADAIRWVLGEQSYGSLRAKRTEDMIFSGSESRARVGMAEASLTLDNSDGWLPIDFNEVTISRRAYRDGQNEYLLNGSKVRLRDVNQLLGQSGLSRRTYTVVGQGLVDAALSLRAEERRELFEEAAGISHYQAKRADALRKLEETGHNLERVHDILAEIKPRLNRLQRQAERAREHLEISESLDELLRTWYGYRWGQALTALEKAHATVEQRRQEHEQRRQNLRELTQRIHQLRQEQSALRAQLGDWHRQSSQLHRLAEQGQRELAVLTERRRLLQAQVEETLSEITPLQARQAAQAERVAQAQAELEAADQALEQHEQGVRVAQDALTVRQTEREKLLREQTQAQKQLTDLRSGLVERRSRLESLSERQAELEQSLEGHRQAIAELSEQLASQKGLRAQAQSDLEHLEGKIAQETQVQDGIQARRAQVSQRLAERDEALQRARQAEAEAGARLDLLDQLRRDFAIYDEATRTILNAALPGVRGVLAQLIDVPPHLSAAVEAALGADAAAIVLDDWQAAQTALQRLKSSGVPGRVTLLPLEGNPETPGERPEGTEALSAQVGCEAALQPIVDRLLGDVYLVPDLPPSPAPKRCVTPSGDLLRAEGALETGRQAESASPLAQEGEWNRLQARRVELGARREQLETQLAQTRAQLQALDRQIADQAVALDALKAQRQAHQERQAAIARQADRLTQQIDWRAQQRDQAQIESARLAQRQSELEIAVRGLGQAQIGLDHKIVTLAAQLDDLPTEELSRRLAHAQTAVAVARQTSQSQERILRGLQTTLDQIVEQQRIRQERVASLTQESQEVAVQTDQIRLSQAELSEQLSTLAGQIEPAEKRLAELETEQDQTEKRERNSQERLHEFESHLTAAELNLARREDELAHLRARIEDDLGLVELEMGPGVQGQAPLPLRPLVYQLPVVEVLPPGLEEEIRRSRAQLRRLGAINPNAPAEYDELLERHTFLNEQLADLKQAGETLQKVIAELDNLIEEAFRQTFEAIAAQFKQSFADLFGGGGAHLELTEPDDLTRTGIEIVARPPGKRQQSLALLSGGERALTAAALIFAILQVSPTPFCVLDEVDAMLDEANVGRFRQALEKLAQQTQFIVITHNRGTITAADTIYGISMGADGVSQAVSLRLEGEQIDLA